MPEHLLDECDQKESFELCDVTGDYTYLSRALSLLTIAICPSIYLSIYPSALLSFYLFLFLSSYLCLFVNFLSSFLFSISTSVSDSIHLSYWMIFVQVWRSEGRRWQLGPVVLNAVRPQPIVCIVPFVLHLLRMQTKHGRNISFTAVRKIKEDQVINNGFKKFRMRSIENEEKLKWSDVDNVTISFHTVW